MVGQGRRWGQAAWLYLARSAGQGRRDVKFSFGVQFEREWRLYVRRRGGGKVWARQFLQGPESRMAGLRGAHVAVWVTAILQVEVRGRQVEWVGWYVAEVSVVGRAIAARWFVRGRSWAGALIGWSWVGVVFLVASGAARVAGSVVVFWP